MSIAEPRLTGRQRLAAISRSMAGLQREHDGHASTKVDAYAIKDVIVVGVRSKHLTPQGAQGGVHSHGEPNSPGPGRSTSEAAINELKKEIARRNEDAQKAGRKRRAARESEHLANLRKWQQL